jgi:hypothetical protein
MKIKKILILSGAIISTPDYGIRSDFMVRRRDYLNAISYYDKFNVPIVFIENSGYDFSNDQEFHSFKNLSIVSTKIEDKLKKGKGYRELLAFQTFLEQSPEEEMLLFKITGRYILENFHSIWDSLSPEFQWFDLSVRKRFVKTSIYGCLKSFFLEYLRDSYLEVDDEHGHWAERVFYSRLRGNKSVRPFLSEPKFLGVCGSTGENLKPTFLNYLIRNAYRKSLGRILHFLI